MKKMFFTAIALVAFSGASMATTKEVKKDKKEAKKTTTVETPCQEMMLDCYETIIKIREQNNGGKPVVEDWGLLNNLLSNCN